jgi:hypothetical protein
LGVRLYATANNGGAAKATPKGAEDCWTWLAIDAGTKRIPKLAMPTQRSHSFAT